VRLGEQPALPLPHGPVWSPNVRKKLIERIKFAKNNKQKLILLAKKFQTKCKTKGYYLKKTKGYSKQRVIKMVIFIDLRDMMT
jgi:hypothetical protein